MDTALFRFGKKDKDLPKTYSTAILPMFATSAVLLMLGIFFSGPIAAMLTYPGKGHYVTWFAAIIAFDVIALIPYAKYRLQNKALSFVKFKILNVVLSILFVLFFLEALPLLGDAVEPFFRFIQSDVDFVFLANLLTSGIVCISLVLLNRPQRIMVSWTLWKKMVWYALPLVIVGAAGSINQFFAVPLQKYLLGYEIEVNKSQAAIYGAVQKIAALLAMFTTAYNYAAEPFFFRHSEESSSRTLYGEIALFFVMTAGLISMGLFLFIDVFQFIIGPGFREGLYLLPILLFSYLFLGIYYNVSIWYKLSDNTIYGAGIAGAGSLITIGGSAVLLPILGIEASAWVSLLCYMTMVGLAYYYGQLKYPIDYPVSRIFLHLFILSLFFLLGWWIKRPGVLWNISMGAFLFGVYLVTILLFEKKRIRQYVFPVRG
jgi:O-antigen/teichoic acid export membrane protein